MTNSPRIERYRTIFRYILAAAYAFVGFVHIRSPGGFLAIIPDWVPYPDKVILITGVCEILGAIGLLTPRLRYIAGIMLATYAVCVFPANIKHAFEGVVVGNTRLDWWYHGPRLMFQPVIVWWALYCAGVIDWPWRQHKG